MTASKSKLLKCVPLQLFVYIFAAASKAKKTVGIQTLGHWTDFSKHVPLQMIKDWKTYVGAHILLIILF